MPKEQLHQLKGRVRAMQGWLRGLFQRNYMRHVPGAIGSSRQQLYSKVQPIVLLVWR
jgi:hypothetical protein